MDQLNSGGKKKKPGEASPHAFLVQAMTQKYDNYLQLFKLYKHYEGIGNKSC